MFRVILSFVVVLIGILCLPIYGTVFKECANQEPGKFIVFEDDCSKAIYCNDIDSFLVTCNDQEPYFSSKYQSCSNDSSVCDERKMNVITTNVPTISSMKPSTASISSTIRPTPTIIPNITSGTSTSSNSFPISTTSSVLSTTLAQNTSGLSCPSLDDPNRPIYLPHPESCSQYYICYHGMAMVMHCPHMLLFDVIQQSCNIAELVNCQLNAVSRPPTKCLPGIIMVYPHPTICNYYYRCQFGYLKVMQCPFDMGWDYQMGICTVMPKTKCYKPKK